MIAAVACCPCTALLVPEVAGEAASDLDELRLACDRAIATMLGADLDVVTVIGPTRLGYPLRNLTPGLALPSFAALPLPYALGSYLLDRAGSSIPRRYVGVAPDGKADAEPSPSGRTGLLVMGDGSARRGEKAPGYLDPRAEPFDRVVAAALKTGDTASLAGLDADLGAQLLALGVGPWKALGAAAGSTCWHAEMLYAADPLGVCYFVATWAA